MAPNETFQNRLRQALSLRNMKQAQLCAATGIPKSAVSQYLSGAFAPKGERLSLIAAALDVNEAWLRGYDAPMEKTPPRAADEELREVLEYYQTKPGMKLLFSLARDATADDIIKAAEVIESLKKSRGSPG